MSGGATLSRCLGLGAATRAADVLLTRSARLPAKTRAVKHGATVRVHHGSGHAVARVFFLESNELAVGREAIAQLRFEQPVFLFTGDRFILRDASEQSTLAGGSVLDAAGNERRFRSPSQRALLRARAEHPADAGVALATQLARDHFLRRDALLVASPFSAEEIADAVKQTPVVSRGDFLLEPDWWKKICEGAMQTIDAFHKQQPDRPGLPLAQLREKLADTPADLVIAELCAQGFATKGETIARATHQMSLPPQLQAAGARIRAALAAKPFDPPSVKELAPDATAQQALRFLRETKELVEIAPDLVLRRDALEKMRALVADRVRATGGATVSDLRQALGSSRRVTVPLLEYFDRLGVTRRLGDKRVPGSVR